MDTLSKEEIIHAIALGLLLAAAIIILTPPPDDKGGGNGDDQKPTPPPAPNRLNKIPQLVSNN